MSLPRPGSLVGNFPSSKNLKRSRTYAGTSSMDHIIQYETGSSKNHLKEVDLDGSVNFDENYDIEMKTLLKKQGTGVTKIDSLKQSGLYPRYSNEQSRYKSFKTPITLDPASNSTVNPYSAVTFKIEDNIKTITESVSISEESNKINAHGPYTKVDIDVHPIELLPYDADLNLHLLGHDYVTKASPFFETLEFSPYNRDETGILLKILNHEFEECTLDEEKEAKGGCDYNEDIAIHIPWYHKLQNNTIQAINDFVKSFQPLSKEEYNKKYPWDKFYDPELYYEYEIADIHELNYDLIATDDTDFVTKQNAMSTRKTHSYLNKRKPRV